MFQNFVTFLITYQIIIVKLYRVIKNISAHKLYSTGHVTIIAPPLKYKLQRATIDIRSY